MGDEISRCLGDYDRYSEWGSPAVDRLIGLGDILSQMPEGHPNRDPYTGKDTRLPNLLASLSRVFPALDNSVAAKCERSRQNGRCRADCPDPTVQRHYVSNLRADLCQDKIKEFTAFNNALGRGWINTKKGWCCRQGHTFETDAGGNAWCDNYGACPTLGTGASESGIWTAPYPLDRPPLWYGFDPWTNKMCVGYPGCNPRQ